MSSERLPPTPAPPPSTRAGELTRRHFLQTTSASVLGLAAGAVFPTDRASRGPVSLALAQDTLPHGVVGKDPALLLLGDRPLNLETPAHLLDDDITPASRMFVRNNGRVPENVDVDNWTLTIDGEAVPRPVTFSLRELRRRFEAHTYQLVLECGGNGRAEFFPPTKGNQWTNGAVSCASWTGARLADVLRAAGVTKDAVYVGYYGKDLHLSGDPNKPVISRGVPFAKAMQPETLLAWAMNGEDIPLLHGAPLRLVAGGWPASVSGKWLTRLSVRDRIHDGEKMMGQSYRVPCAPVRPGQVVSDDEMCIIESMPVRSVITTPASGLVVGRGEALQLRGHAWAGELAVKSVDLSYDFGQTWQAASLRAPKNRLAWQRFDAKLQLPGPGYYEVFARATDERGRAQPMLVPGWNPKGYLNNACHRIAVRVA
ncbi:MAG: sulfite oxidase [Myxococcota bacterium]